MLTGHDIQVVVDLTMTADQHDQRVEADVCARLGIEHTRFPLRGNGTGDPRTYAAAVARIDRAVREGTPVLVHCTAGTQRTGGVLAVYGLLVQRQSIHDAVRQMRRFGWRPESHPELLHFVNRNMSEIARQLVLRNVITEVPEPLPQIPGAGP